MKITPDHEQINNLVAILLDGKPVSKGLISEADDEEGYITSIVPVFDKEQNLQDASLEYSGTFTEKTITRKGKVEFIFLHNEDED